MFKAISRIKDQGPRALRVCILAFLAGFLLYLDRPGSLGPVPFPLVVGLFYALFITPAAVLTAAFLPGLTAFSDAVQLSRLGFATGVALFPDLLRPVVEQPIMNATLVILGGIAIVKLSSRLSPDWVTLGARVRAA